MGRVASVGAVRAFGGSDSTVADRKKWPVAPASSVSTRHNRGTGKT
jgi:hypothetical protein